ncbi:MAG: hypothetical protein ABIF09_02130 [Gemmatimonadota bacterium]
MNRSLSRGLSAAAGFCLLLWGLYYSSFDLWGDELISLKDYALVDFTTTVTTYLDPNNHVLFNLLNNAVSELLGIRDLYQAMDQVPFFRWLQWLVALGTCLYVFLIGKRFFSSSAGSLSLVFLVTCLPFLNFSMQLRGYGLSMFFAAALAYHTWSAEERRSWKDLVLVSITAFGILYVIPSNAYFALALGLLVAWRTLRPTDESERRKPIGRRRGLLVVSALSSGVLLALLAYSPVLTDVFNNRFVEASPGDRMFILSHRLPQVAANLASFRYLVIPIALGGFFFALRKGGRRPPGSERATFLIGLLLLPFLFSFLRDDEAFQRTFIFLAPIFSLALGTGVSWCVQCSISRARTRDLLAFIVAAYAFGTLGFAHTSVQARLEENLRFGIKEQTILANYYQLHGFRPSRVALEMAKITEDQPGPILLVDELDPVSLSYYLLGQNLNSTAILSLSPSEQGERGTFTGHFQRSQGRDEGLSFFWSTMHFEEELKEGNLLAPSLAVAEGTEPSAVYYVVTAFPEMNRQFFRDQFPFMSMETVFESEGFTCLGIRPD